MTGDQGSAVGWAERPGGGMLARMLAEAFHSAEQSDRDSQPCATCGGDRLAPNFTGTGGCHA